MEAIKALCSCAQIAIVFDILKGAFCVLCEPFASYASGIPGVSSARTLIAQRPQALRHLLAVAGVLLNTLAVRDGKTDNNDAKSADGARAGREGARR